MPRATRHPEQQWYRRLGCAVKTVSRKLNLIREAWLGEDELLRQVLDLLLEGLSQEEIAKRLGCTKRTIARKLDMICDSWLKKEPS